MGSGLIAFGIAKKVPNLEVVNWLDDPRRRLDIRPPGQGGDGCPRNTWVRSIGVHTTIGENVMLVPGLGPGTDKDARTETFWRESHDSAGAQFIVDGDGTTYQGADATTEMSYHANTVNNPSVGIECKQDGQGRLYQGQLDKLVILIDELTRRIPTIPRFVHWPFRGPLLRLAAGGRDFCGIFGHRDVGVFKDGKMVAVRGRGDPSDAPFEALIHAGYEKFDFGNNEDKFMVKQRQREVGMFPDQCDGIRGPKTIEAFIRAGHFFGQWVTRPGDLT